jgi:hypothetical protein
MEFAVRTPAPLIVGVVTPPGGRVSFSGVLATLGQAAAT